MTLCRQSRGQRPLGKTVLNRPFPAVKWSQRLTFVEFIPKMGHSSEIWFQNVIFLSGTFQQVNSQEPCLLGSSPLAILSILWRLEVKVIFLSKWGIRAMSPVYPERKKQTKQNPETKTNMETHATQFLELCGTPLWWGHPGTMFISSGKSWGGGRIIASHPQSPQPEKGKWQSGFHGV